MKREIKFRAFDNSNKKMIEVFGFNEVLVFEQTFNSPEINENIYEVGDCDLMQFTGLKDKNKPNFNHIYEGDILSLNGIVIGNIYENKEMVENKSNLVITDVCTREWRDTEKEAMDRGCSYS